MDNRAGYVLIGVDGGATEVRAHAVACDDPSCPASFRLRDEAASRVYEPVADFRPLPAQDQLAQRANNCINLSADEKHQGALWVAAAAEAVSEVVRQCGARQALVGVGMPGLKTADRRGICVINNGPRIPHYLDQLERRLAEAGVELVAPVAELGSDADYCGLGEQFAAEGLFHDVKNAYYVGCGTGIADALKLGGQLVTFDRAASWMQKSWQISSALGPTFEKLVSARSMNDCYARLLGEASSTAPRYPEIDAAAGRPLARAWMETVALVLAELIFERTDTLKNGRRDASHRGESYGALNAEHEFRGALLDRVVIGQRIGQLYADPRYRSVFGNKLHIYLAAYIAESQDHEMISHYLTGDQLKPGFLSASRVRAAPALGAAIAALQAVGSALGSTPASA